VRFKSVILGPIDHRLVIYFGGISRADGHDEKFKSPEHLMLERVRILCQQFASGAGKDHGKLFIPGVSRGAPAGFEVSLPAYFHFHQADFNRSARLGLNVKRGVQLVGKVLAAQALQGFLSPPRQGGFGQNPCRSRKRRDRDGGTIKQEFSTRSHTETVTQVLYVFLSGVNEIFHKSPCLPAAI
jgi:hypothetical protein